MLTSSRTSLSILVALALISLEITVLLQVHADSTSLLDACRAAEHPQLCVSSLSMAQPADLSSNSQMTGVSNAAVNSAMSGIGNYYSFAANLQGSTGDMRERYSLSSCLETLQDSQDEMANSLGELTTINPINFKSKMTDVLTWMSAALTYHTTCLDGWENSPGATRDAMVAQSGTSQRLVENAVSLVANLVGAFETPAAVTPRNRRLLSEKSTCDEDKNSPYEMDGEQYPTWLQGAHRRRLLQQTTNLTLFDATVAQDGTGQYKSIQAAVNNVPKNNAKLYVIKIKQGVYFEKVTVSSKATNVMFVGDGISKTVISGSMSVVGSGVTTYQTATIAINGRGFVARDITFRNTAGPNNHQAVAARVDSDKSAFFRCSFEGYQDTLYAHTKRQFYKNCTILGTVDFIFGNAAAVFQTCIILVRAPLSGQFNTVTAQGRTISQQNTGFSFQGCYIDAASDLKQALATQPIQTYLGRPWKLYSRTVFLTSYMTNVITPAGWAAWNGTFALSTLFYGEYQNGGPGAAFNQRVSWATHITDPNVANRYTVSFIQGATWLPSTTVQFQAQL